MNGKGDWVATLASLDLLRIQLSVSLLMSDIHIGVLGKIGTRNERGFSYPEQRC